MRDRLLYLVRSLPFRLVLAINLTAVAVLVVFGIIDYRRERSSHLIQLAERLNEEAKVLAVASEQLHEAPAFQVYIDRYCRQMEARISPGHHIVAIDERGNILARAHVHAAPQLESGMIRSARKGYEAFWHAGHIYMTAGAPLGNNRLILVGQSLTPITRLIHQQVRGRVISATAMVALVVIITNVLLVRWVTRPIRALVRGAAAISQRHFAHRVSDLPTSELQSLASGFNQMAASLEEAEARRRQEMDKARRIHLALLPDPGVRVPGLAWAARYVPASTIGGDYYDLLEYPDGRWLLVIADVSGHGVPAALTGSMLKALIRHFARIKAPVVDMVRSLNQEIELLVGTEHFVTCVLALYDPASGDLTYVNCGHEPGIIVRCSGEVHALQGTGLPLGVMVKARWGSATAHLQAGDSLFLFTDGLTENAAPDEEQMGRERFAHLLKSVAAEAPARQVEAIIADTAAFHGSDHFDDDVTLVAIRKGT